MPLAHNQQVRNPSSKMSSPSKTPAKRMKPVVAPEPVPITEEPVKRRAPKVAPCEKPSSYRACDIELMDDAELAREFTRITAWSSPARRPRALP